MSSSRMMLGTRIAEAPSRRRAAALVRWLTALLLLGGAVSGGWFLWDKRGRAWWAERAKKAEVRATYEVRRGDLAIIVTAKGSLKALKSDVLSCQVEGKTTIIDIVPEGEIITAEDVKNKRPLVRLDQAEISERLVQQEITFANAEAAYTEAKEGYDIQKSQVESDTNKALLDVKFGRMDLQRHVGEELAAKVLDFDRELEVRALLRQLGAGFPLLDLDRAAAEALGLARLDPDSGIDLLEIARTLYAEAGRQRQAVAAEVDTALTQVKKAFGEAAKRRSAAPEEPASPPEGPEPPRGPDGPAASESPPARANPGEPQSDVAGLTRRLKPAEDKLYQTDAVLLGGAARQSKRKLDADIDLVIEEFKRAIDTLISDIKLESEGFVNRYELEAAELAVKRELINLQQALSARDIFLRYELPKEAEKLLSDFREAKRELGRVEARGRSALAQKMADLRSKEATFSRHKRKLEKLREQIGYCTIVAPHPGIVVYASSQRRSRHGPVTPIDKGASVYERMELIRLPDLSTLAVSVGVHESEVSKLRKGLPVDVHIDAMPNLRLKGTVSSIGILPRPKNWWNRDNMEFETEITVDGDNSNLKPGMSAHVEINVRTLKDVILVPVQAVSVRAGKQVVYVLDGDEEVPQEVKLGESNDTFVEILAGLEEGQVVLKEAPQSAPSDEEEETEKEEEEKVEEQKPGPSPGAGGPRAPQQPGVRKSAMPKRSGTRTPRRSGTRTRPRRRPSPRGPRPR